MIPCRTPPQQPIVNMQSNRAIFNFKVHDPALFWLELVNRSLIDKSSMSFMSFIVYVPLRTSRSNIQRIRAIFNFISVYDPALFRLATAYTHARQGTYTSRIPTRNPSGRILTCIFGQGGEESTAAINRRPRRAITTAARDTRSANRI